MHLGGARPNIFTSPEDLAKVAADPTNPKTDTFALMMSVPEPDAWGKPFIGGFPALGMWTMLKKEVAFEAKERAVADFNAANRWRKRGFDNDASAVQLTAAHSKP